MEQYDVMCPICGTLNKGLFLDETGGWMECEHCHTARKHTVRIPLIKMGQLAQYVAPEAV